MSQVGIDPNKKAIFGSQCKMRFDPYSDEELDSEEFFWKQLKLIVEMKSMDYFNHFNYQRSRYIDGKAGM